MPKLSDLQVYYRADEFVRGSPGFLKQEDVESFVEQLKAEIREAVEFERERRIMCFDETCENCPAWLDRAQKSLDALLAPKEDS